jgi:WD40 repeat protein
MDTFKGYDNEFVYKLCSLDNNYLAIGYKSNSGKLGTQIRILNSDTGGLFVKLRSHTGDVLALAKLETDKIASGSQDRSIKIWIWKRSQLLENLTNVHSERINNLIWLVKRQYLISCSDDKTINVWKARNWTLIQSLKSHSNSVGAVISLNNENNLVSCSGDKTIKIWNLATLSLRKNLNGHNDGILTLAKLNQTHFASGSSDKKIKLWNLKSERELKTLSGHSSVVWSVVLLGNGNLASASSDETIRIWDLKSATQLKVLFGHSDAIYTLAVLTDGNLVSASGSRNKAIMKWHFSSNSSAYFSSK